MKIWESKPPGTLWATPDLLRDFFTFLNEVMKGHAAFLLEFLQNSEVHYVLQESPLTVPILKEIILFTGVLISP